MASSSAGEAPQPDGIASRHDDVEGGREEQEHRLCRICFEGEDPAHVHDNPLISPCLCSGGSRYIHRECLQQWRRACEGTARQRAVYRCEVCHYSYRYRRLDHAAILAHPATIITCFLLALAAAVWLLGYVPLVQALVAVQDVGLPPAVHVLLHLFDGTMMLGLISFGVLLFTGQLGRTAPSLCMGDACASGAASCGDCGVLASGGAECGPILLVVLAGVALLGLVAMVPLTIRLLFEKANELAGAAVVMVENVQHQHGSKGAHTGRTPGAGSNKGPTSAPAPAAAAGDNHEQPADEERARLLP